MHHTIPLSLWSWERRKTGTSIVQMQTLSSSEGPYQMAELEFSLLCHRVHSVDLQSLSCGTLTSGSAPLESIHSGLVAPESRQSNFSST